MPAVERLPGGSSQAAIADAIAELVELANGADRLSVVVDITACGVPFLRSLRKRQIRAAAVLVGAGAKVPPDDRTWQVPMRELLAVTLDLLAENRVEIADVPLAGKLLEQLEAFRTKAPPKDGIMSDWRPVLHTDLAGALMLAAWWGERMLRSIVRQPPAPRVPVPVPEHRMPTLAELGKRRVA